MKVSTLSSGTLHLVALAVSLALVAAPARSAENPALWKASVRGDHARVLAAVRAGLEAHQFQILGEDNLSRGLENNLEIFGAQRWNTIGFGNVTAVHFCSLAFNQQVFNINMDWAILCPFKVVVFNMKATPDRIELMLLRPGWILSADPHPDARRIGALIEQRIVEALKEGAGLP